MHAEIAVAGIYNISSVRATVTGMASGYKISNNRQTSESVTHIPESWTLQPNAIDPSRGVIVIDLQTFGLPVDEQSTDKR